MRQMLIGFFIAALLGLFADAKAQLPPKVMADKHLIHAEQLYAAKDYAEAFNVMKEIIAQQQQVDRHILPEDFHFKYACMALSVDSLDIACKSAEKYLSSKHKGQDKRKFYNEALELLIEIERQEKVMPRSFGGKVEDIWRWIKGLFWGTVNFVERFYVHALFLVLFLIILTVLLYLVGAKNVIDKILLSKWQNERQKTISPILSAVAGGAGLVLTISFSYDTYYQANYSPKSVFDQRIMNIFDQRTMNRSHTQIDSFALRDLQNDIVGLKAKVDSLNLGNFAGSVQDSISAKTKRIQDSLRVHLDRHLIILDKANHKP